MLITDPGRWGCPWVQAVLSQGWQQRRPMSYSHMSFWEVRTVLWDTDIKTDLPPQELWSCSPPIPADRTPMLGISGGLRSCRTWVGFWEIQRWALPKQGVNETKSSSLR